MKIVPVNSILRIIVLSVSLTGLFLYFGVFNRFHLSYLEQNQLFRYNADYLSDFFSVPGGLITLAGSFLTQFKENRPARHPVLTNTTITAGCASK